jgi:hypothetical protein
MTLVKNRTEESGKQFWNHVDSVVEQVHKERPSYRKEENKVTISDERLYQLAYDPLMCNISEEVQECLRELVGARRVVKSCTTREIEEPEYDPVTGEELEHGCYMMGTAEDGLCDPITGCPGCAQERRQHRMKKLDSLVELIREEQKPRPYPEEPSNGE